MQTFRTDLKDRLKDPKFKKEYEKQRPAFEKEKEKIEKEILKERNK